MRRVLAAVGAWAVVGAVLAAPPEPPPFGRLVDQLGAPRHADREAAGRELERRGEPALPALAAALRHPDAEVRRRAGELLRRIRSAADTSHRLRSPTVSLDYRNVPLAV